MAVAATYGQGAALWLLEQVTHVGLLTAGNSEPAGFPRGIVPAGSWAGSGSGASNTVVLNIGTAPAGSPELTQWALWDGGTIVLRGPLNQPRTPAEGAPLSVPVGAISVTVA